MINTLLGIENIEIGDIKYTQKSITIMAKTKKYKHSKYKKTFLEELDFLNKRQRVTKRLFNQIDILPKRYFNHLSNAFKAKDRDNVKYFVLDMWKPYRDIARTYFKNAKYIIDKYYWIRNNLSI